MERQFVTVCALRGSGGGAAVAKRRCCSIQPVRRKEPGQKPGQLDRQALFGNKGIRAVPQAVGVESGTVVARNQEGPYARIFPPQAFDQSKAVQFRHFEVGDDQVGLEPCGQGEAFPAIGRLGCDADAATVAQQARQCPPEQVRIVHQHDAEFMRRCGDNFGS